MIFHPAVTLRAKRRKGATRTILADPAQDADTKKLRISNVAELHITVILTVDGTTEQSLQQARELAIGTLMHIGLQQRQQPYLQYYLVPHTLI